MIQKHSIEKIVRWLCRRLCFDELLLALQLILEVAGGRREDIQLRRSAAPVYPHYRQYTVDPHPPLTGPPVETENVTKQDYKELLAGYRRRTDRELKPVRPAIGGTPGGRRRTPFARNATRPAISCMSTTAASKTSSGARSAGVCHLPAASGSKAPPSTGALIAGRPCTVGSPNQPTLSSSAATANAPAAAATSKNSTPRNTPRAKPERAASSSSVTNTGSTTSPPQTS